MVKTEIASKHLVQELCKQRSHVNWRLQCEDGVICARYQQIVRVEAESSTYIELRCNEKALEDQHITCQEVQQDGGLRRPASVSGGVPSAAGAAQEARPGSLGELERTLTRGHSIDEVRQRRVGFVRRLAVRAHFVMMQELRLPKPACAEHCANSKRRIGWSRRANPTAAAG